MNRTLLRNPFSQWEITTVCDMGCEGCQVQKNTVLPPIPLDTAIIAINDLANAGIQILEFIGGEPYKYSHMLDVIKYIYNEQPEIKRFAILTNAMDKGALANTKPFLSKTRGGIVVSINYTLDQCEELLRNGVDIAMAKKSIAGWEALDDLIDVCWVRVNCVINKFNIQTFPEIALQVIQKGALFSCCPFVYKRTGTETVVTFRSKTSDLAPIARHQQLMEKSAGELVKLKLQFPDQIVPSIEYLKFLPQTCKRPEDPYSINCKGLGLPYLRVSSEFGKSKIDEVLAPKLRACTDIIGERFSEIVTSDLKYPCIVRGLDTIYSLDPQVMKCQTTEGCPWSVTFALSQQK